MARIRKRHSPAFKAQVALEAAKQTKTIAELAKQFQVHPVQINAWKKQLLDGVEAIFQGGSVRQPGGKWCRRKMVSGKWCQFIF